MRTTVTREVATSFAAGCVRLMVVGTAAPSTLPAGATTSFGEYAAKAGAAPASAPSARATAVAARIARRNPPLFVVDRRIV
jgi:hypothetical protein